ncbi:ATP-grasp domain-containing protein [bacterium]|nr:ATP-grasp domain-containing protein [bacterium]MCI0604020.1 ATP-grasp domain-containing protein [bacterium]
MPKTILCIASYEKGHEFLRQCKREDWRVILLTSKSLEGVANWPTESIDEVFYIPDVKKHWNMNDVIYGVSYMARTEQIDRIVALDDYDVEKAASLREHLRIPGIGDTGARYFRDKLAMRRAAAAAGIAVPKFVHILNYRRIQDYMNEIPPPYVLKPRLQAGAIGIRKIDSAEQLWKSIDELGDEQSFYVLEKYIPGKVHHVDSILYGSEILMAIAHEYGIPPMEVAHQGRVFSTRTMVRGSEDEQALQKINRDLLKTVGLQQGVSHTEFIKGCDDNRFYFLETSARVGGAHIADLVQSSTGLNLWAEWAKIETLLEGERYQALPNRDEYGGLLVSLAKQEWPDLSSYDAPEVFWRLKKKNHAGIIVTSPDYDRVTQLLNEYTERFYHDFFASAPPLIKPGD